MTKIVICLAIFLLFGGCKNEEKDPVVSPCLYQMKERFKDQLKCTKQGDMEVNLYQGVYEGQTVYFAMTMCPACFSFGPTRGYTCEGLLVGFDEFAQVTAIRQVYNSCTGEFMEY